MCFNAPKMRTSERYELRLGAQMPGRSVSRGLRVAQLGDRMCSRGLEGRGSRWGSGEESGSQLVELPIGAQWRRDLAGVVCCQLRVGEEARWPSRRGLR